ncbi:MAG: ferritin-like domain-containing protein [bacterium]|nr:ferritin-like domain-containing protein [bacterium]
MKLSRNAIEQAEMLEEVLHEVMSPHRRKFLKKGALVAAAAAALPMIGSGLAGCSDASTTPTDDTKARDIRILSDAFLIEKLAINTYTAAAATGLLTGAYSQVATSFINDHAGHGAQFKSVITADLGGTAPADPAVGVNFLTGIAVDGTTKFKIDPVFGNFTTPAGILKYAIALELTAAQSYFTNITSSDNAMRLTHLKAIDAMSDIAPVEAQHAAVFRAALKLLIGSDTDKDAGADIGASISPTSAISQEMPRP